MHVASALAAPMHSSWRLTPEIVLHLQRAAGNGAVAQVLKPPPAEDSDIVACTFLGVECEGGVNLRLQRRLEQVEAQLRSHFASLPVPERTDPRTGVPTNDFIEWCGIREPHKGRHGTAGLHPSGSAIDINYRTNPYIVTRTDVGGRTVLGGEGGGGRFGQERQRTTEVYDRALQFIQFPEMRTEIGARRHGESIGHVYDRLRQASDAMTGYFLFAFRGMPVEVGRPPIVNPEEVSLSDLLLRIPEGERVAEDQAMRELEAYMHSDFFQMSHPDWPYTPEQQYARILRDYELVRVPMVIGSPSSAPERTRNPARGFLDLRRELVVALTDGAVGRLRWGGSDFGPDELHGGPAESGDLMHFDLGHDAPGPPAAASAVPR